MTSKRPSPSRPQEGFTLIELMIVMGIMAILAAMIVPSYQTYQKRGRIAAAKNAANCIRSEIATKMATNNADSYPMIATYEDLPAAAPSCLAPPGDTMHQPAVGSPTMWCYWQDPITGTIQIYPCWDPLLPDPIFYVLDLPVPKTFDITNVYDTAVRLDSKYGPSQIPFTSIGTLSP